MGIPVYLKITRCNKSEENCYNTPRTLPWGVSLLIHPAVFGIEDLVVLLVIHHYLHQAIVESQMILGAIALVVGVHSHAVQLIVHRDHNLGVQVLDPSEAV